MQVTIGVITLTAIKEKNAVLVSARRERKAHPVDTRAYHKTMKRLKEQVTASLRAWNGFWMEQVND